MALKVSVCIPSYNRRELLLATLRSLDRQTAPPDAYEGGGMVAASSPPAPGSVASPA